MHPTYMVMSAMTLVVPTIQCDAYLCSIENDSLPTRRDNPGALSVDLVTEPVAERLEGEKLVHETGIVSLHDDTQRNDEREDDCLPPEPQGLSDSHVVLIVDGRVGIVDGGGPMRSDMLGHLGFGLVFRSHVELDSRPCQVHRVWMWELKIGSRDCRDKTHMGPRHI